MAVLSVDLACKRYEDIGLVVLASSGNFIKCERMQLKLSGLPRADQLAAALSDFCINGGIKFILLDGPQAWKSSGNGLVHCRRCERELNTPAKTGEPFQVKPSAYSNFVSFSIETYDHLANRGWQRLSGLSEYPVGSLVETFPMSAWKLFGLSPLKAKSRCRSEDIQDHLRILQRLFSIEITFLPTHDELQAIVAGLCGLALERADLSSCKFSGISPSFEDGFWREGYIVNRLVP